VSVGKGFYTSMIRQDAGSKGAVVKKQQAFMAQLVDTFVPKQLLSFLPQEMQDKIRVNPELIPTALRFFSMAKIKEL